jgi:two-component sensor histidine kinase
VPGRRRCSEAVRPLIGRDLAEVLRIVWEEPFASEAIARFRTTLTTGESFHSAGTSEQRGEVAEVESYDWQLERVTLPDGQFGVVCYFYDLTERKRYEQHIRLLLREINHRSKNMLGLVQAIAHQTAASRREDFIQCFSMRMQALGACQDLLVKNEWQGADLASLARSQLAHFADLIDTRIHLRGPPVTLSASAARR